jgi:predicted double-glycine peptidase
MAQAEIMSELDSGDKRGLSAQAMKALAERHGLRAFIIAGGTQDVFHWLERGVPPIVARRVAVPEGLGNHYMVIVGVSPNKDFLAINDPEKGQIRVLLEDFLTTWTQTQRFMMIVAPGAPAPPASAPVENSEASPGC